MRSIPADIFTYNSLIDSLCKNNYLYKAIALVKKIKDQGIQLDMYTYNTLIDGLCKGDDIRMHKMFFRIY
jgi:pentatricopeptide repeat domain-containing protein 1